MSRKPKAPFEDSRAAALDAAARLLARREHSARELAHKLGRKGYSAATLDEALQELRERDWLNESRYAQSIARHRASQGRGPRWVEAELQAQGISEADCQQALAQPELDWDAACALALRKFRPDDPRRRDKLYQRGFSADQIAAVLR